MDIPAARTGSRNRSEAEALVNRCLPLVKRVAYQMLGRLPDSVTIDELLSAGYEGLVLAAERYDPARGPFEGYAEFRIRGAIIDELRTTDHLSRGARRRARDLERAGEGLAQAMGRVPTEEELADHVGLAVEDLRTVAADAHSTIFLNPEDLGIEEEDRASELCQLLGGERAVGPYAHVLLDELRDRLVTAIGHLEDPYRLVVALYYGEGLNFKEIGAIIDRSESRICQLHSQALATLRQMLADDRGV